MGNNNSISAFKQFTEQLKQYFIMTIRDKKNLAVMLLFPALASLITVWIAGENMYVHYDGTKSGLFVIVSAAIWGGLFNSIQTVVKERANIKRDYITGLKLRSYTFSRAVLQLVLCFIQSLILCTAFIGIHLKYDNQLPESGLITGSSLFEFFVTVFLLMYAADAMGLMVSCMVRKAETANVMAPYILIVQLIFSGILFSMKGAAEKVSDLMLSKWGMEALGSISDLNNMQLKIQMTVPTVPHEFEDIYKAEAGHLEFTWLVFLIFIVVFLFLGNLLLHRVSKDSR